MTRIPMPLFVVRHGQTDWNVVHRLQGRTDVPLNALGRAQAAGYGRTLKRMLEERSIAPDSLDAHVSPLGRAQETFRILCSEAGIPDEAKIEERLIEQNFGNWEGKTFDEVARISPKQWAIRQVAPLSYLPEGGETGDSVKRRIAEVISECQAPALLVGHFGTLRALVAVCEECGIKTPCRMCELSGAQNIVYVVEEGELKMVEGEITKPAVVS